MKKNITILSLILINIISVASAAVGDTIKTFLDDITDLIGETLSGLLITIAVAFFIWAVVIFLKNRSAGSGGAAMNDAKEKLMWSIIGLFVLFSIWGIIIFLQKGFGFNTTEIDAPTFNSGQSDSDE